MSTFPVNDFFNGVFEFGMAVALFLSVLRLRRDKRVHGWSVWSVLWPTLWGFWNLYYYPSLGQIYSFVGGIFVVSVNCAWIVLAMHYECARKRRMKL